MVNMNENGRKEYEQPKMDIVMINPVDIIAQSPGSTGGNIEGGGGLEED